MPVQKERRVNAQGQEVPDDTPVDVPVRFREHMDIHQKLKDYVASQLFAMKAEEAGLETEEEANDFLVGDAELDELPLSQAERAMLMAEELEQSAADLVALEGAAKRPPAPPAAEKSDARPVGDVNKSVVDGVKSALDK